MPPELVIRLEGTPERVQRFADAIELVLPGAIGWQDFAIPSHVSGRISVAGIEHSFENCTAEEQSPDLHAMFDVA